MAKTYRNTAEDQDQKCWACGRKIKGKKVLVQLIGEDQKVYVGPDCAKDIDRTGKLISGKNEFPAVRVKE